MATEIEKYFDMSIEIRQRHEVLAAIDNEVIGRKTTTAMLAERELAK